MSCSFIPKIKLPAGLAASSRAALGRLHGSPRTFLNNRDANISMIFSLSLLPVLGMIAVGVDYGRAVMLRSDLQSSLDAAVLAAVSATGSPTATQRQTLATNYLNSVFQVKSGTVSSSNFTFNSTLGTMTGTVTASLPTMLGQNWLPTLSVTANSTASVGSIKVRALDVAMCIDTTGSMSNTLGAVQSNALNFYSNLSTALSNAGVPSFDQIRVRVIYYRDYGGNGYMNITSTNRYGQTYYPYGGPVSGTSLGDSVVLNASSFYTLPGSANSFSTFVNGSSASGGGDLPESGLECLNAAMASSWTAVGATLSNGKVVEEVYPVISIYTDAGAHPPSFTWSLQNPSYPAASVMPRDYAGLLTKWNDSTVIDQTNKMILFYGNPAVDDDYYFGNTSGWQTIKTWPGFSNPGSLTSANTSFVTTLATGIATNYKSPTLTH